MITFFTTAKPFKGHSAIIQRNALESWRRLHPDTEIILLGDDAGVTEICRELSLRYEPHIERRENGTKTVRSVFRQAQKIARHNHVCYCNCDIIFTADFASAFQNVRANFDNFLMVGQRWDTDITEPLDFSDPAWQSRVTELAKKTGIQRLHYNIDYFVFPRGFYSEFPDLLIGRLAWDNWLVWKARELKAPVVDASAVVCAVHQNHDYSYHPQGMEGVWNDVGTRANFRAAGGWGHLYNIEDATHAIDRDGNIESNRLYWLAPARRRVRLINRAISAFFRTCLWHPILNKTRTLRHSVGLRNELLDPFRRRKVTRRHWQDE